MHLRMFSCIGETFSLSRLAKRQISAILRIVPKLTAEMPNAACGLKTQAADITGQLDE